MKSGIILLISVVILTSQISLAHQIKCEIFDLAYGDNLIETEWLNVSSADLKKTVPYKIILNHELMNAEFTIGLIEEDILFQIQTREAVNSEYGNFKHNISQIKQNKNYELGRVFTEITGMGDNTLSHCYINWSK